jgi:hypothetical protein
MSPQLPCKSNGQHIFNLLVFLVVVVAVTVDWDGLPDCCDVFNVLLTVYHRDVIS